MMIAAVTLWCNLSFFVMSHRWWRRSSYATQKLFILAFLLSSINESRVFPTFYLLSRSNITVFKRYTLLLLNTKWWWWWFSMRVHYYISRRKKMPSEFEQHFYLMPRWPLKALLRRRIILFKWFARCDNIFKKSTLGF